MSEMKDYLARKAQELDLDRGQALKDIQAALDRLYPGQIRALSLQDGVLKIITPVAGVASDLRLRQVELLAKFNQASGTHPIERLHIHIRSLS